MRRSVEQLGEILVELGVITPAQLAEAASVAARDRKSLGMTLVALGLATDEDIDKGLSVK